MKSTIVTSLICFFFSVLLLPNEGLSQKSIWKKLDSGSKLTIYDSKSKKEYTAKIDAILVNHEEQVWLSNLKENCESSYMLGLSVRSETATLIEELYQSDVPKEQLSGIAVVDLERFKLENVQIADVSTKQGKVKVKLKTCDVYKK